MKTAIPLLFLLFGSGCLALGLWYVVRLLRLRQRGVRTVGVIRERTQSPRPDGGSTLRVTIEFLDSAQIKRQAAAGVTTGGISFGSAGSKFEIGDQVPIIYDPAEPNELRIDTFLNSWFGPMVVVAIGLTFLTVSALIIVGTW
jgi:Protein of unknown function (DUF3592)